MKKISNDIICWWSGGVTSAVAGKLCIDLYGVDRCLFVFIDTKNEHEDTYRFKKDCEAWYGKEIKSLSRIPDEYQKIQDVWVRFKSLNVAHGAICSSELKRKVRLDFQQSYKYTHQVFGFDVDEPKRARSMKLNYPEASPIFPLLLYAFSKKDCINMLLEAGIEPPLAYKLGFNNNNCLQTGCVQGGVGYWQKMRRDFPEKFNAMADMEHKLTNLRGEPVTMLKDQSKKAKNAGNNLVFLKPHPDYPEYKDISMMKGREPKMLMECNGFCGSKDLDTDKEDISELNLPEYEVQNI